MLDELFWREAVSLRGIVRRLRRVASAGISTATAAYVNASWKTFGSKAKSHTLPGRLTVTMTSYPPRFGTLALTVKSILSQSVRPDRVCLWISASDIALLPKDVRDLEAFGLELRPCRDVRSFTKIIPAIEETENQFLVTADDDQYYPRSWLKLLVESYRPGRKEIVCARAHRIRFDKFGVPLPYMQWEQDIREGSDERLLFPTGVGGVLYEPYIFHGDVTNADLFRRLCPLADDVWLYWMAAMNGARFRKVGPRRRQIIWGRSQHVSLFSLNRTANDEQIAKMIAHYGFPVPLDQR